MLDYELKRMINKDIELCREEWDNYSFDWERMGRLFEKMINRYIGIIDGFDKDLNVISGYEKKNTSGDTYRNNISIIIKRLEAFRDNGYKNEGLHKETNKDFNISRYDMEAFNEARMVLDASESLTEADKAEVSQKLDEIEGICSSNDEPTEKWNRLRPYVLWLSGKNLVITSQIMPLLSMLE